MTLAKVQPFCNRYGLDIGVFNLNSKRVLPWTVEEKKLFVFIQEPFLCKLEKKEQN